MSLKAGGHAMVAKLYAEIGDFLNKNQKIGYGAFILIPRMSRLSPPLWAIERWNQRPNMRSDPLPTIFARALSTALHQLRTSH
jgi:hypothetical protein